MPAGRYLRERGFTSGSSEISATLGPASTRWAFRPVGIKQLRETFHDTDGILERVPARNLDDQRVSHAGAEPRRDVRLPVNPAGRAVAAPEHGLAIAGRAFDEARMYENRAHGLVIEVLVLRREGVDRRWDNDARPWLQHSGTYC